MLITKRRPLTIAGIRHVQLSPPPPSCKLFALGASAASGSIFFRGPRGWDKPPNFGGNCQMVCNQVTRSSQGRHVTIQLLGPFFGVKTLLGHLFLLPFLGQKNLFLVGCPKPPCFITGAEFLNNSVASLKDQIMNRSHPKAMTIAAARGTSSSPSTFNLYTTVFQFQQHRFNQKKSQKKTMAWKEVPKRCIVPGKFGNANSKFRSQQKRDGKKNVIRLQKLKIIQHIAGTTWLDGLRLGPVEYVSTSTII